MDLKLKGKLALVTGSGAGIGKATAKMLLCEGSRVILHGRSKDKIEPVAKELASYGETYTVWGDLGCAEETQNIISEVEKIGDLDILVNNCGFYEAVAFDEITDDQWQRMMDVNLMSMVRLCRHYLPKMLKRNAGKILCVSSEVAYKPLPTFLHYCVSKTAVLGLARGLAELTKGTNVTVNTILPGPTWTEGTAVYQQGVADSKGMTIEQHIEEYFNLFDPTSLTRRFVDVTEIASTIVYYCSELSNATNGAPIRAEGGLIRSI